MSTSGKPNSLLIIADDLGAYSVIVTDYESWNKESSATGHDDPGNE